MSPTKGILNTRLVIFGVALFGFLLIGQDCLAQTNLCDPDPCQSIPNAVAGTCTEIDPPCAGASDYMCSCDPDYTWKGDTHTCEAGGSTSERLVPDTGIEVCYDNTQVISCPAAGQPFYGQDAQYVTNTMSFTDHGNGTVTDNITNLMWQREDDDTVRTWADAISYCEGMSFGGHTDWRLPDEYELQSIVDYGRYAPPIDTTVFPSTNFTVYWSSSTSAHHPSFAWGVEFESGGVADHAKTNTKYVRCVRGETTGRSFTDNLDGTVTHNETGLMWQEQDDNVTRNWEDALAYCENLILPPGGHTDWRLPDMKALRSIVDNTRYNPAIDMTAFPNTTSDGYWTSSTYASDVDSAGLVEFTRGYTLGMDKTFTVPGGYVRCVRW